MLHGGYRFVRTYGDGFRYTSWWYSVSQDVLSYVRKVGYIGWLPEDHGLSSLPARILGIFLMLVRLLSLSVTAQRTSSLPYVHTVHTCNSTTTGLKEIKHRMCALVTRSKPVSRSKQDLEQKLWYQRVSYQMLILIQDIIRQSIIRPRIFHHALGPILATAVAESFAYLEATNSLDAVANHSTSTKTKSWLFGFLRSGRRGVVGRSLRHLHGHSLLRLGLEVNRL